ncbi:methyltransferase domain-containing protein [Salinispirillum sp. LH 10-3-1]|uniref:Methyltransferase domain-containing protein n=1 Tax=Salinispirillum sp. LH 10-3-1 TaxID=2952525 RepID=A0AB38YCP1_9GAMM
MSLPEYLCPICQSPLSPSTEAANSAWRCENNHSFDAAKQGYLNLLLPQQRKSRAPGDTAEMVQARTHFLNAGHYQPLADGLLETAQPSSGKDSVLLDLGCGEGYYTEQLHALPWAHTYGLDISKPAVIAATRRTKNIHWSVASMRAIPLASDSVDLVTCVFAYYQAEEVLRVLKPEGQILLAVAGPDHLLELRQAIYPELKPQDADKARNVAAEHFDITDDRKVQFNVENLQGDALWQLLLMTPHYWRAPPPVQEQIRTRVFPSMTVDVRIIKGRKRSAT